MYNPKSLKAEEFICHEEVLDTLDYAQKNKDNVELIDSIIEKAKQRKGLSHRDASVLLACEIPEKIQEKLKNVGLWDVNPLNLFRISQT